MSVVTTNRCSQSCEIPLRITEDFDFSGSIFRFGGTKEFWRRRNQTSMAGVIYVYTDYIKDPKTGKYIPGVKIGDGNKTIGNLPFVSGWKDPREDHFANKDIHITAKEREYWNSNIALLLAVTNEVMHDRGVTETEIYDRCTTSPVFIKGDWYEPQNGDVVTYNDVSYIWIGTEWDQAGAAGVLKALAYKDYAKASYLPHGHNEAPEFKGEECPINIRSEVSGTITKPKFTGKEGQVTVSGIPNGKVDITQKRETIGSVSDAGEVPQWGCYIDDDKMLHFNWNPGKTPTVESMTLSTEVEATTFVGEETESRGSFTPEGENSAPEFKGDDVLVQGTVVPKGTVTAPKFHGTREEIIAK